MVKIKIGLEIHCQLNTESKLFCSCRNQPSDTPNIHCCPTCLGHPGSKPSFNKKVLEKALKVALALKCKINKKMIFSRKNYFFPDLPNNFQITQYEFPLASKGKFNGISLTRIHIEEDPGRLIHKGNYVLMDYNRSGTPLIEIVTDPVLVSAVQAKNFVAELITTLEYLDVYYKSSEASLRCDVNISINNGKRVEVKNVYGINDIKRVLEYEIERQKNSKAVRETRGWDSSKGITYEMRSKEQEKDYGYITEPNLPTFNILKETILKIKESIPELPSEKSKRLVAEYKIKIDDAKILASSKELANLFEKVAMHVNPLLAAKWLRRELKKLLTENKCSLKEIDMDEKGLINILELFSDKKITDKVAKELTRKLFNENFDVEEYVKKNNLLAVSDEWELLKICVETINKNPQAVKDYSKGNENALNFLLGKVMQETKGKASPNICKGLLKKKLDKIKK
ncbi:MAG: Asp-tRNA(Asn)/Glu-tRNA(Gln) amidotransferase subunit GatB [Nanoarchaeota archaeon]|nr:Asp-tRNA(Asn)/Glu-tRNA(Gln) amidotransferase subunit GatB [Nanoarchaeota archaeon]